MNFNNYNNTIKKINNSQILNNLFKLVYRVQVKIVYKILKIHFIMNIKKIIYNRIKIINKHHKIIFKLLKIHLILKISKIENNLLSVLIKKNKANLNKVIRKQNKIKLNKNKIQTS